MTKTEKLVSIQIGKIHNVFDVRLEALTEEAKSRREERILSFADHMDAGVKFPPLLVTQANSFPPGVFPKIPGDHFIVIDGRTRVAAYGLLDAPEVSCVVKAYKNFAEAMAAATGANCGGPEPMTRAEIERVVLELAKAKMTPARIHKTTTIAIGVINSIISKARLERIQGGTRPEYRAAITAYKRGVESIESIAARFGLNPEDLKKRIVISERAERKIVSNTNLKAALTTAGRKCAQSVHGIFKTAYEAYQDDKNLTADHIRDLLVHSEKMLAEIQRAVSANSQTARRVLGEEAKTA